MDEADVFKAEQEQYTRNLQGLVKSRTDQLQEFARQNQRLRQCLQQIQSMESLEQVREAAQACMQELPPNAAAAPNFGGEPGDPVPEVDAEDLEAIWRIGNEAGAGTKAIGFELIGQARKPGANVQATWYRSTGIWLTRQIAPDRLAPWIKDGEVADPVFRAMASIPMQWMEEGVVTHHPPFDIEEFFRRLKEK